MRERHPAAQPLSPPPPRPRLHPSPARHKCFSESITKAMDDFVYYLNLDGVKYGQIWLDIEQGGGWSTDLGANCQYVRNAVAALLAQGVVVGVYSSEGEVYTPMRSVLVSKWWADFDYDYFFSLLLSTFSFSLHFFFLSFFLSFFLLIPLSYSSRLIASLRSGLKLSVRIAS